MSWEKSAPELVALLDEVAPKEPGVERKPMFGWPCCFVNGNLFMGLHKQSMIFRLAEADRAAFLELDGAGDFEPMPGRKMKGYTILAEPGRHDHAEVRAWAGRALEFTRGLPAKSKAAAKKADGAKRSARR
jgi:hypothetical protein